MSTQTGYIQIVIWSNL